MTLSEEGHVVIEAGDGLEATELCEDQGDLQIDMLITDVIMPGSGGKVIADYVAKRYADAKISFMTGYSDVTLDRVDFGHDFKVIRKPFTPESLLMEISEQLAVSRHVGQIS